MVCHVRCAAAFQQQHIGDADACLLSIETIDTMDVVDECTEPSKRRIAVAHVLFIYERVIIRTTHVDGGVNVLRVVAG